jgi:hypothetical protein
MKNPTTIIILFFLFFPLGLYFMWKREVWSLETRVILSLIFFFPLGLYFMWKEKELWSNKIKIVITFIILCVIVFGTNNTSKSTNYTTSSSKCLLNGCNNQGNGWIHYSQSLEMRRNNLFGVYRIQETGGYCSREHGHQDN